MSTVGDFVNALREKHNQEMDRLTARVAALEEGLKKYGKHYDLCNRIYDSGYDCNCGLKALLSEAGDGEGEKESKRLRPSGPARVESDGTPLL